MGFDTFLVLFLLSGVLLRWLLFQMFDRKGGAGSFLVFLLDPRMEQDPRSRGVILAYLPAVGGGGLLHFL